MLRKLVKGLYHNDPIIWRRAIDKFRQTDRRNPPPTEGVLFIGSSSIRFWQSLARDMAPYPVINRGFGGSMMHQVLHYFDEIVLPYRPAAIFLYAGENDIAGILFNRRHSAEEVCQKFQEFCQRAKEQLPTTSIYYISIKPAKRRQKYWPEMQRANRMIGACCDSDPQLHYVDVVPAMQNKAGQTRTELFTYDGVHMNKQGYAVWTRIIRPLVEQLAAEGKI